MRKAITAVAKLGGGKESLFYKHMNSVILLLLLPKPHEMDVRFGNKLLHVQAVIYWID